MAARQGLAAVSFQNLITTGDWQTVACQIILKSMKCAQIAVRVVFPVFLAFALAAEGVAKTYSTNFPLTENPISESGNWTNGKANGLDWANIRTTSGFAYGTQSGNEGNDNDSTALLAGTWGPNQAAQATVHSVNQKSNVWEEVEIRLRSTITPHSCTGYEINFRCTHDGSQYVEIVRWNGALDNFTYVVHLGGGPGIYDGDVVKATISGSTISAYINGALILTGADATYTTGNPGMGFYLQLKGQSGSAADFGFTSFAASDSGDPVLLPPSNAITSVKVAELLESSLRRLDFEFPALGRVWEVGRADRADHLPSPLPPDGLRCRAICSNASAAMRPRYRERPAA